MSFRMSAGWHSLPVRLTTALVLALLLLLPVATVYAGDAGASPVTPTNSDICVEGTVIDHEENPLDDGRIVTATMGGVSIAAAVDEDGEFSFEDGLTPGVWTFAIDVVKEGEEWEAVTPASFAVELAYGNDNCYQIRFKLRRLITVIVTKIDENHNRLIDWRITAKPGAGNPFAINYEETTDSNGEAIFRLSEGKWIFTEAPPEDDDDLAYTPVVPLTGAQELTVEAPGPYEIRFKNRLNVAGCINVLKQDVPPDGSNDTPFPLQGWRISLYRADDSLVTTGLTGADGEIEFSDLPYGPYTVVEEERVGWAAATASSYDVELSPDNSSCVQVTFDNAQADPEYCIEGRKIDANGSIGLPGWTITADPLDNGDEEPADVVTDGLGMYKFTFSGNDYRVPGSSYRVCEDYDDVDGWVPVSATCYTVKIPTAAGSCAVVPDFVNKQVGHSVSTSTTTSTSSGSCRVTHVVKKGDSVYGVAAKYGVSASAMLNANSWVRNTKNLYIYPGQKLCVP